MNVIEASVAMYVVENERASKNGKSFAPKYLIFRHNANNEEDWLTVRAYGRSSTVKTWLGDIEWEYRGFNLIQDYPGQWLNLEKPLYIAYEEKLNDDNEFMYYIAVGIDTHREVGQDWGWVSLNNEIATIREVVADGGCWLAEGDIAGELMRVTLWPEHRRAIEQAGYQLTWDKPEIALINADGIQVVLQENMGRRRVDEVLKVGTEDEWVKSEQKR